MLLGIHWVIIIFISASFRLHTEMSSLRSSFMRRSLSFVSPRQTFQVVKLVVDSTGRGHYQKLDDWLMLDFDLLIWDHIMTVSLQFVVDLFSYGRRAVHQ